MSQRLFVGTRKGLFTLHRDAAGWQIADVQFLGEPVTMCLHDPRDGAMYAVLTLGHFGTKLRRSTDEGQTWNEVAVPVYPDGAVIGAAPFDSEGECEAGGQPKTKPASLTEIWSLETAKPSEPGTLWAGTIPGGLFHSSDRGESWQLVESLWNRPERMEWFGGGKDEPGIHTVCVDPRDARHVTIAISCGGIWETRDGGESWNCLGNGLRAEFMPPDLANNPNIQDAHRLAQCAAHPDVMWVQHHNGIFHSTDGAKNFREIVDVEPATFGFAVCAHPHDENTAWFVPGIKDECRVPKAGALVVTRTRDGGKTFEVLRDGLPQRHAYDLIYRHALDVDATGEQLAMGSTTGGLWTSDNAGDAWQEVSHTLPPIYCVRFEQGG